MKIDEKKIESILRDHIRGGLMFDVYGFEEAARAVIKHLEAEEMKDTVARGTDDWV